jgi:hypothetical protein
MIWIFATAAISSSNASHSCIETDSQFRLGALLCHPPVKFNVAASGSAFASAAVVSSGRTGAPESCVVHVITGACNSLGDMHHVLDHFFPSAAFSSSSPADGCECGVKMMEHKLLMSSS